MYHNMGTEVLFISISIGIVIICMIALVLTIEYIRKNRFEKEKNKSGFIGLDSKRSYYEEKIYELQKLLSENERRWKDSNHLVINGQQSNKMPDAVNLEYILKIPFFKGLGITEETITIDKKLVFVLTPFLERETKTYLAIQQICNEVGLVCRRGDEIYRKNDILSHIVSEIVKARVVIVNINGRNPNVFYELGICHAIGKPAMIISSVKDDIPFDVMSKNIVIYKDLENLKNQLKVELLKMFIDE